LCLVALSSVWQWARTLAFVSGISVTVVSVMLAVIIYRLYKDMTNKKDETTDEDTEEKEN
jgi:membrane protein implicated in regulation of membrane protease activity